MDEQTWNALNSEISKRLTERGMKYVTPLSTSAPGDLKNGQIFGTGNYIQVDDGTYILTCAHVVTEASGKHLSHLPIFDDFYRMIKAPMLCGPWREDSSQDVALSNIPSALIRAANRQPLCIRGSDRDVLKGDMVFHLGYPEQGSWMSSIAQSLLASSAPYLTVCSRDSAEGFKEPDAFFQIEYPMNIKVRAIDGKGKHLRNAPGQSGSIAIGVPQEVWLSGDIEQCMRETFIAGLIVRYADGYITGIKHSVVMRLVDEMVTGLKTF